MIDGFYYEKSDMITKDNAFLTQTDPYLYAKHILSTSNTPLDTLTAIENYNTANNLDIYNRIPYLVFLRCGISFNVIKAVKKGTSYHLIGYDEHGFTTMRHSDNGENSRVLQSLVTLVVNQDNIEAVSIGAYDMDNVIDIVGTRQTSIEVTDELYNILTKMRSDINALDASGQWRNLINMFNINMNKYSLNDKNQIGRSAKLYNMYVVCFEKYIQIVRNIVQFHDDETRNIGAKIQKFHFFTDQAALDAELKRIEDENIRDTNININNSFTNDEISKFRQIGDL